MRGSVESNPINEESMDKSRDSLGSDLYVNKNNNDSSLEYD